jgi:5-methylcytosine-specific restriction endonuclease McrA
MFQNFAFGAAKCAARTRVYQRPNTNPNCRYLSSTKRVHFTAALKRIIGADQHWRCAHCSQLLPACFQIDHIRALHKGGDNNRQNLQALCPNCHATKSYIELYEGGKHSIPSREAGEVPSETEADEPDEAKTTSVVVCKMCGVKYSNYFRHMCRVSGC